MNKPNNTISRRQFIGTLGAAAAVTGLASCVKNTSAKAGEVFENKKGRTEYRSGVHGEQVSLLGYGCMRWPTIPGNSAPGENNIDQEAVNELIDYAIAHGVNYFDSSPAYCRGFSEEVTGIALARYAREHYYIATKLSNFDPSTWSFETSKSMYKRSLKLFHTDYLDFYLLHGIGMGGMENLRGRYLDNGILDYLLEERAAGHLRNLGFSYHGDITCFDYLLSLHDKYHWDFVQIQMNYVDWHYAKQVNPRNTDAEYLYNELDKRGISAVIMEPILGGRLASLPEGPTRRLKTREPERSIASWAFRFSGTYPRVLTILSGMTYMEHLQDNLSSFAPFKPLTADELDELETIAHEYVTFPIVPCTNCQYCMPCPYGLDIPGTFRHYNDSLNEGRINDNPATKDYRKLRREYLNTYTQAVARERQADHCIGCGQCKIHCPQHIDIPAEMQRIDKFVESLRNNVL
jgi:hypothetical protein